MSKEPGEVEKVKCRVTGQLPQALFADTANVAMRSDGTAVLQFYSTMPDQKVREQACIVVTKDHLCRLADVLTAFLAKDGDSSAQSDASDDKPTAESPPNAEQ